MKFCEKHWERLKGAIDDRGLKPFCATSSEDMGKRMKADLEAAEVGREPPATTFEPLMGAHNAILSNTLRAAGLEVMFTKADGSEWCPVCFLMTCPCGDPACAAKYEGWIERAADDMLAAAKELGLVKTA